jgi:molybdopterin molybdotransferase
MTASPPPPIPLDEAQARLLAQAEPLGAEVVSLAEASGRFLAHDIIARRMQPAADLSAMDGYAMRDDDMAGPWNVVGESAAGHPWPQPLQTGEAVRISTGAMMPSGAAAVLLQEDAVRHGSTLMLAGSDAPSPRHVRRQGFDFAQGDVLLAHGTSLNAARIALALSAGYGEVAVGRQPRVAIIDSGDELAADPAVVLPHQIPASNGPMLATMVAPLAANIRRIGPVPDRMEALVAALESATDCDVIVTSGGASVGDHDLIKPALAQWGADIAFWRIALKPGKPLLVARKGRRIILGLPGNPVSSYVTAFLFVLPFLRALAGASAPTPRPIYLPLSDALPAVGKRTEFLRAVLAPQGITPVSEQDSSAIRALSVADGLIRREIGSSAAVAGERVPVYLLQNGGMA